MNDSASHPDKKPLMSGGASMYWTPAERMPLDLFSYIREAGHCFMEHRFLASITMASTAIELILNRDQRLKELAGYRDQRGWANLNNRSLRIAAEHGLPSNTLLSRGDDLNSEVPINFVNLRNKVAHGEIAELVSNLSDYDASAEQMAEEQLKRMRHFVSQWFNSAPDVQEGHIRKHRWPTSA